MKNFIILAICCLAQVGYAQTLGYNDIGFLFSNESINGTARYNGLSGSFGALGGDLSAMDINPAGAAIFLKSEFTLSVNALNRKTNAFYYGNSSLVDDDYSNVSQAGGVFVFKTNSRNSFGKIAIGFNYSTVMNFEDYWFAQGNNNYPTWTMGPYDDTDIYLDSDGQGFESATQGKNHKYSFTFASQINSNLYLGIAINTHDIEHYQQTYLEEFNNDGMGNTLDANLYQELLTYGEGLSINLGLISKITDNLRLGLAYQTPTWYNLSEDYLDYDLELYESLYDEYTTDYSGFNAFDYKLKTPGKTTGSLAYIFEKQGFVNLDITYKDYSNINLSNANFSSENNEFKEALSNTLNFKLGTEWRFKNLAIRGGYHHEKSPYNDALDTDKTEGFSLGAGLKFRGGKVDLSYQKNTMRTAPYSFYPQYNNIDAAELEIDQSRVTATLTLSI